MHLDGRLQLPQVRHRNLEEVMARRPSIKLSDAIVEYLRFRDAMRVGKATMVRNASVLTDFLKVATEGCPVNYERTLYVVPKLADGPFGIRSVGPDISLQSVNMTHVTQWRMSRRFITGKGGVVRDQPFNSANADASTIRGFFKWASNAGIYKGPDPCAHIKTEKGERHQFLQIPRLDWGMFLDAASNPRDRFLLVLALYTLARSREIAAITVGQLQESLDTGLLKTHQWKIGARDELPVGTELHDEIEIYLKWYQKILWQQGIKLEDHHVAIPAYKAGSEMNVNDPLTGRFMKMKALAPDRVPARLGELVKPALQACGYETHKEGMHTLRRSAAKALYYELQAQEEAGELPSGARPISIVSDMCGHASEDITWAYIGVGYRKDLRNQTLRGATQYRHTVGEKQGLSIVREIG